MAGTKVEGRKRTSNYVDDSSDNSESDRASKRSKTTTKSSHIASAGARQKDDNGDTYWDISGKRRVVISRYSGKTMVTVREYYEKDGKMLPSKKGISMPLEQFSVFVRLLPSIESALQEGGEDIPRPKYDGERASGQDEEDGDEDGEDEDAAEVAVKRKGNGVQRKSNIEATSDEDEDD